MRLASRRHVFPGVLLFAAWLAVAGEAHANAPRFVTRQTPSTAQSSGRFIEVKLPAVDAIRLRSASTEGIARMRAVSGVADRLVTALNARGMRPTVRTELLFPEAIELGLDRWFMLEVDPAADVKALVSQAKAVTGVDYAEPDLLPFEVAVAPNDSLFSKNWGHGNTATFPAFDLNTYDHNGPNVGTVGFDANVQKGWGSSAGYGSASVIIAILDSGVDPSHPDLHQVKGYDFWANDSIPEDQFGHGTGCAGIAAGIANNAHGVAGAAGGCSIMPLRAASTGNDFTESAIANGMSYAATHGAKIISMSFGGHSSSSLIDTAIDAADSAGLIMFAAAGNYNEPAILYPASHAKVIAVGAASPCGSRKRSSTNWGYLSDGVYADSLGVSCDNEVWWGSSWGVATKDAAAAVDIMGPTMLPTTDIQGAGGFSPTGYSDWFNGTSCATPYVAGIAALVLSQHPTWTPAQVRQQLMDTAIDIADAQTPVGWDKYTGYGMVNAAGLLPDLTAGGVSGWYAPSLPYKSGVGNTATAPTVLDGNVNNTIFAYSYSNPGHAAASGFQTNEYIDGVLTLNWTPGSLAAGAGAQWNSSPRNVRGGLHTLGFKNDVTNVVDELDELDNNHASQWVWSPLQMTLGIPVTRPALPDPQGGWSDIPPGMPHYSNVDGLRSPTFSASIGSFSHLWGAVAVTPTDAATNPDLQVSDTLSTGPSTGFRSPDEFSSRPGDATDFVLAYAYGTGITLDVGLYKSAGNAPVKVQAVESSYIFPNASATYGPFSLGPDSLIALFDAGGSVVRLVNLSGNANLDLKIFAVTDSTRLYNPGQAIGTAAAHGNGGSEYYNGTAGTLIAVYKAGSSDVAKTAVYKLVVAAPPTDVDADVPTRIAFEAVSPNPAREDAALQFELPQQAHVDLDVFDIGGRCVSRLSSRTWAAGRHVVQWSLLANDGHAVPSGVYLVRFRTGSYQETRRLLVTR